MDGGVITLMRTAAASAVALKVFSFLYIQYVATNHQWPVARKVDNFIQRIMIFSIAGERH